MEGRSHTPAATSVADGWLLCARALGRGLPQGSECRLASFLSGPMLFTHCDTTCLSFPALTPLLPQTVPGDYPGDNQAQVWGPLCGCRFLAVHVRPGFLSQGPWLNCSPAQ